MAKKPGVGYVPDDPTATWVGAKSSTGSFPINFSAPIPGGDVGGLDTPAVRVRYRSGIQKPVGSGERAQGFWNELFGNNEKALIEWFKVQPAAHREKWTGIPTPEEKHDLAFTESQTGSDFYRTYWLAFEPGGTKETAIVVDQSNWTEHGPKFPRGVRLGLQTKANPIHGLENWYDVRWKPAGFPDPLPPPAVGAEAEFWQQSAGKFVPGKVKEVDEREQSVTFTPATGGRSVTHALDDGPSADMPQGRLWRLKEGSAPAPQPSPPAPPAPTPPAPPKPTPAPKLTLSEDTMKTFRAVKKDGWIPKIRTNQRARYASALDELEKAIK
jgi:hypothetical protein